MNDQLELESVAGEEDGSKPQQLPPGGGLHLDAAFPAVTIGRLVGADPTRGPLVDFATNNSGDALLARSVVPLEQTPVGSEVALMFEEGVLTRPIVVGVLQEWNAPVPQRLKSTTPPQEVEVQHDADSLLLTAAKEITLQCGKASITLTSAGKLLLRGAYLLSRSSGVNRIKGGSVQIN